MTCLSSPRPWVLGLALLDQRDRVDAGQPFDSAGDQIGPAARSCRAWSADAPPFRFAAVPTTRGGWSTLRPGSAAGRVSPPGRGRSRTRRFSGSSVSTTIRIGSIRRSMSARSAALLAVTITNAANGTVMSTPACRTGGWWRRPRSGRSRVSTRPGCAAGCRAAAPARRSGWRRRCLFSVSSSPCPSVMIAGSVPVASTASARPSLPLPAPGVFASSTMAGAVCSDGRATAVSAAAAKPGRSCGSSPDR